MNDLQPASPGLMASLTQLMPYVNRLLAGFQPLLDQPIIRMPYSMPLSQSAVVAPGSTLILTPQDFSYSLEWPLEVHEVKFSQDPAHTYRDWRVAFQDQTFNQPLQKSQTGSMVAQLVDDNTGKWCWKFPWTVRPKGGALNIVVTNLDTVNPITVDIDFIGYMLIPRSA